MWIVSKSGSQWPIASQEASRAHGSGRCLAFPTGTVSRTDDVVSRKRLSLRFQLVRREPRQAPSVIVAMHVFLDFEASSLKAGSYPIEVGWAREDGETEAHLIRPAPGWLDWDATAEAVHKIEHDLLLTEGEPYDAVARRVLEALAPHQVFVSAPSWDGKWMSVLLRAAGLPRHALKLKDCDLANRAVAREVLGGRMSGRELEGAIVWIVAEARRRVQAGPPRHRALADAVAELEVWREVRKLAETLAAERPVGA